MAIFTKKDFLIIKQGRLILQGQCNYSDGLCDINFHTKFPTLEIK